MSVDKCSFNINIISGQEKAGDCQILYYKSVHISVMDKVFVCTSLSLGGGVFLSPIFFFFECLFGNVCSDLKLVSRVYPQKFGEKYLGSELISGQNEIIK